MTTPRGSDRLPVGTVQTAAEDRGQSEVLALVLILGLTIMASVSLAIVGAEVIDDSHTTAEHTRMEQVLTQLDSRSAVVGLGDSNSAAVDFGNVQDGDVHVDESAGWLRVTHHNYSGSSDETVYNVTLGSVRYESDDTVIAYQGGGVWRTDGNGTAMVAQPELYYRDATLTLPVISVSGTDSASGPMTATVREDSPKMVRVFPNSNRSYGGTNETYQNVISDGYVTVTVRSEYYRAWADYVADRTAGGVSVDHANKTVSVDLIAFGTLGPFEMPPENDAVEIRGLRTGHQIENFTIVLAPDNTDAAQFDNLQWSFYGEQGNREVEIHLRNSGRAEEDLGPCKEQTVAATVYFSETNGNSYYGWHNETAFRTECVDRDDDGVADETRLVANLTGNTTLQPADLNKDDLLHFNTRGVPRVSPVTFDEHEATVSWEPRTFYDSCDDDSCYDEAAIDALTNHYLARMGTNFDLVVDDKNSDTVNEDASWGELDYEGKGRITYLHVTENNVRIDLE